jgi:protein-arginine kinase activator protein McsA
LNLESKKLTPLLNIAPQKVTPENSLPWKFLKFEQAADVRNQIKALKQGQFLSWSGY